jgi:hypothetical protein
MSGDAYTLWRHRLSDGAHTTIYAVRHPGARLRALHFPAPRRLDVWCQANGVGEAIVGGFFLRDPYRALGEVWVDGRRVPFEPVGEPYADPRACVIIGARPSFVRFAPLADAPSEPRGDLVQAGPLLVEGGAIVFAEGDDREGFSAGAGQFDSDITEGRHPRAALGLAGSDVIAVACDGRRTGVDAGLTMRELAQVMVALGAESAINLDGGGSTTLVHKGHLLNRPYSSQDQPAPESRPVVSALALC